MYQALASALNDLAWWLQSASQVVPISQLSIATWLMFVISGYFDFKEPFKASKQ
jgi:hypothetical protein